MLTLIFRRFQQIRPQRVTVVVGGKGYESDSITVDDGFRKKPLKLYAGGLRIAFAK